MGSTAVVVVQRGAVIAEWGDVERPVHCHSLRKSFLSALYGQPVRQGTLSLGATLAELGIDDAVEPRLTDAEKQATVEHLLQARSGVYHPAAYETPAMVEERPAREPHPSPRRALPLPASGSVILPINVGEGSAKNGESRRRR